MKSFCDAGRVWATGETVDGAGNFVLSVALFDADLNLLWRWDDPAKRTLLQVKLEDALAADEMFRTLMGEKVEPRREFIQKHALEVKDIDYHGA